jgi:hypothetical protein
MSGSGRVPAVSAVAGAAAADGHLWPCRPVYQLPSRYQSHQRMERKKIPVKLELCMAIKLQSHNTENSKKIFPEKELRGHDPNFHIHVSIGDLYIPTLGLPILLQ